MIEISDRWLIVLLGIISLIMIRRLAMQHLIRILLLIAPLVQQLVDVLRVDLLFIDEFFDVAFDL